MLRLQVFFTCVTAILLHKTQGYLTSRSPVVAAFVGCGKALPSGQAIGTTKNVSISSGGFQRSYLVFIPPTYNSFIPTPLILSYHGGVRTALDQLQLDQLTSPEFNTVSIVVYPQGINVGFSGITNLVSLILTVCRILGRVFQELVKEMMFYLPQTFSTKSRPSIASTPVASHPLENRMVQGSVTFLHATRFFRRESQLLPQFQEPTTSIQQHALLSKSVFRVLLQERTFHS